MLKSTLKLSLLFLSIGLITSRFALILHEFIGHGLPAVIFGGKISGFYLYLFGGGYLNTTLPPQITIMEKLIVMMGGIGVEMILAILLFKTKSIFKNSSLKILTIISSFILVLHALTYFILSVNYGYGDGFFVYSHWGSVLPLTLPLSAVLIVVSYALAGKVYNSIDQFLISAATPKGKVFCLVMAALFAASTHAALAYGEIKILSEERTTVFYENLKTDHDMKDTEAPKPFPLRAPLISALSMAIIFSFYNQSKKTGSQEMAATNSLSSFVIIPILLVISFLLIISIKASALLR